MMWTVGVDDVDHDVRDAEAPEEDLAGVVGAHVDGDARGQRVGDHAAEHRVLADLGLV